MVRHRECYDDSLKAGRTGNGPGRYSLLGLAEDILEVRRLAQEGGAGPVGPEFERLYWHEETKEWTSAPTATTASEGTWTSTVSAGETPAKDSESGS